MEQKTMKNIKKVENQLVSLLKDDEKLAKDQKMSYLAIANLFLENFDKNIDKTSIELNKDIPIGIDTWKEFLNYPVVRKYIQGFKDEKIMKVADSGLMQGDKNAIGIKKVMQGNGPAVNNSNIVIIRLPEKVDF